MQAVKDGFVKVICLPTTGIVIGGVVVAPSASELIHPLSIAVRHKLTVDQLAESFTVYPSLSGSLAEADVYKRQTGSPRRTPHGPRPPHRRRASRYTPCLLYTSRCV